MFGPQDVGDRRKDKTLQVILFRIISFEHATDLLGTYAGRLRKGPYLRVAMIDSSRLAGTR